MRVQNSERARLSVQGVWIKRTINVLSRIIGTNLSVQMELFILTLNVIMASVMSTVNRYALYINRMQNRHKTAHKAPKFSRAILSSFTAVGTSSKFSAEIAHLACFCAAITDSSSVL